MRPFESRLYNPGHAEERRGGLSYTAWRMSDQATPDEEGEVSRTEDRKWGMQGRPDGLMLQ